MNHQASPAGGCLGLIPTRGGSRGLPRKNVLPLAGRPLIVHTIQTGLACPSLDRLVVSSDDDEIAAVAAGAGAQVIRHPPELSGDGQPFLPVLQYAVTYLWEVEGYRPDYVVTLLATCPLRQPADVEGAIAKMRATGADSVISLVEVSGLHPTRLKRITDDDRIVPAAGDEGCYPIPRQHLPPVYKRNAAVYLTRREVLEAGSLFGEVSRPYVMPPERSVDIDSWLDLRIAACLLSAEC